MALGGQKGIWEFCKSWFKKGSSGYVRQVKKKLIIYTKVIFKNKKESNQKKNPNSIPLSLGQN